MPYSCVNGTSDLTSGVCPKDFFCPDNPKIQACMANSDGMFTADNNPVRGIKSISTLFPDLTRNALKSNDKIPLKNDKYIDQNQMLEGYPEQFI